jgi:hypothetical protein
MAFAGINYPAVIVAAIISFLFGGMWYGLLSRPWLAAIGKTEEELKRAGPLVVPMVIAAAALLVMAYILAGVIGHLGPGQVTAKNGLVSAFFVWLGFIATTLLVNDSFQGANRLLTAIDAGHWLGVLLIQGAVIGWMGVR